MPSPFTHLTLPTHTSTGAAFPSSTPVIGRAVRGQKRTKGRGEEKRRIYVEKSQWRNKTVSTFSPLNVRAHRGRTLRDRRSASRVRNNTRRGSFPCGSASLKRHSSFVLPMERERKGQRSRAERMGTEQGRQNKKRGDGDRKRLVDAKGRDPTRLQTAVPL